MAADEKLAMETAEQEEFPLQKFHDYEWVPRDIPLKEIEPNEEILAPAPTQAFRENMKSHGQTHPILVEPVKGKAWRWHILDGRNRTLTARSLGMKSLKGNVVKAGEVEALLAIISSNKQRRDNKLSLIDTLRKLQALKVPLELCGLSAGEMKHLAKLAKLDVAFQNGVRSGLMTVTTAEKILTLDPPRRAHLKKLVQGGQKVTAQMVHAAKRDQVEGMGQMMAKLNIPPEKMATKAWEGYIVFNATTNKASGGILGSIVTARNRAATESAGAAVYKLVPV